MALQSGGAPSTLLFDVAIVVAVSEALARALRAHGFPAEVIYNGVEPELWRASPAVTSAFRQKFGLAKKKIVLAWSRISAVKRKGAAGYER